MTEKTNDREINLDGNCAGHIAHGSTVRVPYDSSKERFKFGEPIVARAGDETYIGRVIKADGRRIYLQLNNRTNC